MPKIRSTVPRDRARIEHHRSNVWPYTHSVNAPSSLCQASESTGTCTPGEAFRSGTWTFAAATQSSTARNCAPGNLRGRSSTGRANGTHALSSMPSAALVSGALSPPGTAFTSGCANTARSH